MPEEPKAESAANEGTANLELPFWQIVVESVGGEDLKDCKIVEVKSEEEYKFTDPDFNSLAESHIFPPIFKDFLYKGKNWTVETNTGLKDFGEFIIGVWTHVSEGLADQRDGEWAAQSGGGADPLRAKAASADAY